MHGIIWCGTYTRPLRRGEYEHWMANPMPLGWSIVRAPQDDDATSGASKAHDGLDLDALRETFAAYGDDLVTLKAEPMTQRMTPERLTEIREGIAVESRLWVTRPMRELLAELDAVVAERDALLHAKDEWEAIARNADGGA